MELGRGLPLATLRTTESGVVQLIDRYDESVVDAPPDDLFVGSSLAELYPVAWSRITRLAPEALQTGKTLFFAHRIGMGTQQVSLRARVGAMEIFVGRVHAAWLLTDHLEVLTAVAHHVLDAILVVEGTPEDALGARVVFANKAWTELTAFDATEIIGRPPNFLSALTPENADVVRRALQQKESVRFATTNKKKDGTRFNVEVHLQPVADANDELVYWLAIQRPLLIRDEGAERAARLASLARMAGGIAHEFNNVLTAGTAGLGLVRELLREGLDPETGALVGEILADLEGALLSSAGLTNRLLTFSSGGAPVRRPLDLAHRVRAWMSAVGSPVDIEVEGGVLLVDADRAQLRDAVLNVARYLAHEPPGPLQVALARVARATAAPGMAPGDYVRLFLHKPGLVLTSAQAEHLFDPFFATDVDNSGLNLAVAYSVVQRHGGAVELKAEPNATSVEIWLPALSQSPSVVEGASSTNAARPLRVLIMDDELPIRSVLRRLLERRGYVVDDAAEGESAIELYSQAMARGARHDVVLLDLTVPNGIGGEQTFRRLRELDPDVCALIVSGYGHGPVISRHRELGFAGYVPKPFSVDELELALSLAVADKR